MKTSDAPEALIVGAGPVGMMTALALADQGVKPVLIDSAADSAQRSFACGLHPRSLELLEGFDLLDEILEWGYRVEKLAFYDAENRRAEIDFSEVRSRHPFMIVLPQSALVWMMERTLHEWAGIDILRGHRLAELRQDERGVYAKLQRAGSAGAASGPKLESGAGQESILLETRALVGADGRQSTVRQKLGIPYEFFGYREHFAVFEFETDAPLDREMRVILDGGRVNVLWPISERRCRWNLQIDPSTAEAWSTANSNGVGDIAASFAALLRARAPWFGGGIKDVTWLTHTVFEKRLANRFSQGRCWLAGDAAHQTGPVGAQSLNVGLAEAVEVAHKIVQVIQGNESEHDEAEWNHRNRARWLGLLGADPNTRVHYPSDWLNQEFERIHSCLPASPEVFPFLLAQLRATV